MAHKTLFRAPTADELYVASTNGAAVRIGQDWCEIPPSLHANAIAAGAITNTMNDETAALQARVHAKAANLLPRAENTEEPEALIAAAMHRIIAANNPNDFTKGGYPDLRRLSSETGFTVSRDQMLDAWREATSDVDADAGQGSTLAAPVTSDNESD